MKDRKHQSHWQDNTRKERSTKRLSQDNAWAAQISNGKYPTLRKLMTAVHNGNVILILKEKQS